MLTVIICTYNPRADYLKRTLNSLRSQNLALDQWELMIVDNNSTPPLQAQEEELLGWHPQGSLVVEEEIGLTAARVCGAKQARGELIVYVDDDNELAPDYLSQTLSIAQNYPHLGTWGPGIISGDFESEPPSELTPYLHMLLICHRERIVWSNVYGDGIQPWGAGVTLRKSVLQAFLSFYQEHAEACTQLGRKGNLLLSGEDHLFLWLATEQGMGKGIFPALSLVHLIPARRLEPTYFLKLMHGNTMSLARLSDITGDRPKVPNYLFYLATCLNVLLKKGYFAMKMYRAHIQGLREGYRDIKQA